MTSIRNRALPLPAVRRYPVSRVELRASDAYDWFAQHGWVIRGELDDGFRAIAEEITLLSTTVTRIWHTPASLASSLGPHETMAILQVHGHSALTRSGHPSPAPTGVSPRAALLFGGAAAQGLHLSCGESVGRIEIRRRARRAESFLRGGQGESLSSWSVTVAMANALLNAGVPISASAAPGLDASMAALVSVLRAEVIAGTGEPGSRDSYRRLVDDASTIIRASATRADFTIEGLATDLAVSRRRLERAFAAHGTSARAVLLGERRAIARAILDEGEDLGLTELARRAGFASSRALHAALGPMSRKG